jgi:DNA-binding XRE family transcriptional regulator
MRIELTQKEVARIINHIHYTDSIDDVDLGIISKLNGSKTEFSKYLQQKRLELDLSQRELALIVGISNAEISRLESGERNNPSIDTLTKLVDGLGVDKEELLNIFFKGDK